MKPPALTSFKTNDVSAFIPKIGMAVRNLYRKAQLAGYVNLEDGRYTIAKMEKAWLITFIIYDKEAGQKELIELVDE
jgi:hypothetical protein